MRHAQLVRRRLQRRQHHRDLVHLRRAPGLGPVIQPSDPLGGVALLPRDHRRLGHPDPMHDLIRPHTLIGQQHDPRPLRSPGRHGRASQPPVQLGAVLGRHLHGNSQRHAQVYREVKLFPSRDTRACYAARRACRASSPAAARHDADIAAPSRGSPVACSLESVSTPGRTRCASCPRPAVLRDVQPILTVTEPTDSTSHYDGAGPFLLHPPSSTVPSQRSRRGLVEQVWCVFAGRLGQGSIDVVQYRPRSTSWVRKSTT